MTETEHLLSCLAEECAEVGQRVSKALRFGLREVQPGQGLSNAERIMGEVLDIYAVIEMLEEADILPARAFRAADEAMRLKKQRVRHYMEYARAQGTIK